VLAIFSMSALSTSFTWFSGLPTTSMMTFARILVSMFFPVVNNGDKAEYAEQIYTGGVEFVVGAFVAGFFFLLY